MPPPLPKTLPPPFLNALPFPLAGVLAPALVEHWRSMPQLFTSITGAVSCGRHDPYPSRLCHPLPMLVLTAVLALWRLMIFVTFRGFHPRRGNDLGRTHRLIRVVLLCRSPSGISLVPGCGSGGLGGGPRAAAEEVVQRGLLFHASAGVLVHSLTMAMVHISHSLNRVKLPSRMMRDRTWNKS